MCTYLARRGATYYFRRVIPQELRASFDGKTEFMFSLHTKDRGEGKRKAQEAAVETSRQLDEARARQRVEDETQESEACVLPPLPSDEMTEIEREQAEFQAQEQAAAAERRRRRRIKRDEFRRRMEFSTAELSSTEQVARDVIREKEARIRALEAQLAAPAPASTGVSPVRATPKRMQPARLMDLFDGYAAERQPKPSTLISWRPVFRHLIGFLGHDDARLVNDEDIVQWKERLLREPTANGKPRSARTVKDNHLAAVKTVLGWAVENRRIDTNPASKVTVRVPKKEQLRDKGFDRREATLILRAALQTPTENLSREHALARRWVPWLCAYTGARVNEIGQLRAQDVQEIEGIWTIRITPEAGTVKTGKARYVPLHSHIVEQGFPELARDKGEGPLFYDPGKQRKAGAGSRHYKKVGERLAAWVRSIGITDPAIQPNHAWRHMFKTEGRRAGMHPGAQDAIQGHAPRTEGEKYGGFPISMLSEELEKLPSFSV